MKDGWIDKQLTTIFGENWLTTIPGLLAWIGGAIFVVAPESKWGPALLALGAGAGNIAAKSFNVHSTHKEVQKSSIEDAIKKADDAVMKG